MLNKKFAQEARMVQLSEYGNGDVVRVQKQA